MPPKEASLSAWNRSSLSCSGGGLGDHQATTGAMEGVADPGCASHDNDGENAKRSLGEIHQGGQVHGSLSKAVRRGIFPALRMVLAYCAPRVTGPPEMPPGEAPLFKTCASCS